MNGVADSPNPRYGWRGPFLVTLAVIVAVQAAPSAQTSSGPAVTVTPNVNVLRNVSDPLLGDAYLQRQTEPVVAISTRNPDHIMVAANDYRTVDIATDQGIGQVFTQLIRSVSRTAEKLWARITGRSEGAGEAEEEERERAEAGTEAWIGVYITNDRGRNWTNAWMPGYPQDTSEAGKSSPAYGRQAASDPVLVAAPAGRFYLGAMAFDRGGASQIVVSRFTDRNNSEKGGNFHFDLMRAVDAGSTGKQFLDKPSIVADVARSIPDAGACGPVYIGYTVFDTNVSDPSDRSRIYVATSLDCGNTWLPPRKVNRQSKLVQGVTLAVRPSDGRLYAAYRDFEANRMYVTWADDRGYTFAPPVDVSGPMLTFDQPSLGAPDYAFRSNAFATVAVTGDNTAYVAWQERLAANGNPRIVITSSVNGGPWARQECRRGGSLCEERERHHDVRRAGRSAGDAKPDGQPWPHHAGVLRGSARHRRREVCGVAERLVHHRPRRAAVSARRAARHHGQRGVRDRDAVPSGQGWEAAAAHRPGWGDRVSRRQPAEPADVCGRQVPVHRRLHFDCAEHAVRANGAECRIDDRQQQRPRIFQKRTNDDGQEGHDAVLAVGDGAQRWSDRVVPGGLDR